MSNSPSNRRPRRSFATGAAPSASQQHVADGLQYDGDDVPVLIRLPDLSPQALLREPAPSQGGPTLGVQTGLADTSDEAADQDSVAAAAVPESAAAQQGTPAEVAKPDAGQSPAASEPVAEAPTSSSPVTPTAPNPTAPSEDSQPAPLTGGLPATGEVDPATEEISAAGASQDKATARGGPSRSTHQSEKSVAAEGSDHQRRRRKRASRPADSKHNDRAKSAAPRESSRGGGRRTASSTAAVRQERNILPFDKSRLTIGAGLVVVATLTYFALSGGGEDPVEPAGTWAGGGVGPVATAVDPISEPEVDLWPGEQASQASHEESSLAQQAVPSGDPAGPATDAPVWPSDSNAGQPVADSYDSATMPAANYSYNAPPITAPANGQGYQAADYSSSSDAGATSGWPSENAAPVQPTSATLPVTGWPDAAMAPAPKTDAPSGAPNGYYQSQAAGYTTSPETTDGSGTAPSVRTGRLETAGPYADGSTSATANPGSQLNGTIEIPRPRANNEYNGSSVY